MVKEGLNKTLNSKTVDTKATLRLQIRVTSKYDLLFEKPPNELILFYSAKAILAFIYLLYDNSTSKVKLFQINCSYSRSRQ